MGNLFFYLYIFTTLFLGTNVKQFLGMNAQDGFWGTIHYYSLPFLFLSILANAKKVHFNRTEKILFCVTVFYFLFSKFIDRSANLGTVFNILIEPICVLAYLRLLSPVKLSKLKFILVGFFFVECGVAIYEAIFNTIVFARDVDIFDYYGDVRAYSLHGHPLQNAFIVCMLSVTFILSSLKRSLRYGLFLLGYIAIFTFNTRSSIYLMGLVLGIALFRDYIFGKGNVLFKSIGLIVVLCAMFFSLDFIVSHSLGTRLETGISSKDGSSMARFLLINAFFMIPLEDLLLGVDPTYIKAFMQKFGLVGIENSIVSLIFYCGAIFSLFYFPLMAKDIYFKKMDFFVRCILYGVLFALLNVNNALVADGPVLVISLLGIYCFLVKTKLKYK